MLQEWLKLSDAEWAVWTRAPSEGVLWAFGVPAAVIALGRDACAGGGEATLIRIVESDDGFPLTQYYWTSEGLCEAEVTRACRARAGAVDRVPTPGLEPLVRAGFDP